MINNINKNSYNTRINTKPFINNKELIKKEVKTSNEKTELFINRIKAEIEKASSIAIKIITEEKLDSYEEEFITNKYPNIKKLAQEAKEDAKELKSLIKNCNSDEEINDLISKAIDNIKTMGKKGLFSELEVKIKLAAIKDVENFSNKLKLQNQKIDIILKKIVTGEKLTLKDEKLLDEKFPNIKQLITELIKENKSLKNEIKNCLTNEDRQQMILNKIKDIESLFKNGMISSLEFKLNMFYIKNLEKQIRKEKNKLFWINPYVYLNTSSIVDNLTGILIIIVIIIGILKFI
ncbi:hypothetical protein GCM10008904_15760 [Paraclostridium ghonii]|uniref:DNA-binding ferritin-like protein n=1 Tax=Paraclostridium ghonii TaxID=29358 RepID=A0ABU0MZG3_9FIRM|nr:hypothetical protein [Paeniclostridium ghonii]MDQ0556304.1 DNA-binding ferritin-like protein [Paeniclostridium ghonii]